MVKKKAKRRKMGKNAAAFNSRSTASTSTKPVRKRKVKATRTLTTNPNIGQCGSTTRSHTRLHHKHMDYRSLASQPNRTKPSSTTLARTPRRSLASQPNRSKPSSTTLARTPRRSLASQPNRTKPSSTTLARTPRRSARRTKKHQFLELQQQTDQCHNSTSKQNMSICPKKKVKRNSKRRRKIISERKTKQKKTVSWADQQHVPCTDKSQRTFVQQQRSCSTSHSVQKQRSRYTSYCLPTNEVPESSSIGKSQQQVVEHDPSIKSDTSSSVSTDEIVSLYQVPKIIIRTKTDQDIHGKRGSVRAREVAKSEMAPSCHKREPTICSIADRMKEKLNVLRSGCPTVASSLLMCNSPNRLKEYPSSTLNTKSDTYDNTLAKNTKELYYSNFQSTTDESRQSVLNDDSSIGGAVSKTQDHPRIWIAKRKLLTKSKSDKSTGTSQIKMSPSSGVLQQSGHTEGHKRKAEKSGNEKVVGSRSRSQDVKLRPQFQRTSSAIDYKCGEVVQELTHYCSSSSTKPKVRSKIACLLDRVLPNFTMIAGIKPKYSAGERLLEPSNQSANRIEPYVTTHQTANRVEPYVSTHQSANRIEPYVTKHQAANRIEPYVSTHQSANRIEPYVTTHQSADCIEPYVTTHQSANLDNNKMKDKLNRPTAQQSLLMSSLNLQPSQHISDNVVFNSKTDQTESLAFIKSLQSSISKSITRSPGYQNGNGQFGNREIGRKKSHSSNSANGTKSDKISSGCNESLGNAESRKHFRSKSNMDLSSAETSLLSTGKKYIGTLPDSYNGNILKGKNKLFVLGQSPAYDESRKKRSSSAHRAAHATTSVESSTGSESSEYSRTNVKFPSYINFIHNYAKRMPPAVVVKPLTSNQDSMCDLYASSETEKSIIPGDVLDAANILLALNSNHTNHPDRFCIPQVRFQCSV